MKFFFISCNFHSACTFNVQLFPIWIHSRFLSSAFSSSFPSSGDDYPIIKLIRVAYIFFSLFFMTTNAFLTTTWILLKWKLMEISSHLWWNETIFLTRIIQFYKMFSWLAFHGKIYTKLTPCKRISFVFDGNKRKNFIRDITDAIMTSYKIISEDSFKFQFVISLLKPPF